MTASTADLAQRGATSGVRGTLRDRLQQFLAFASLIVIFAFFAVVSPDFLNYGNVTAILFSTVVIGTLALGTTFVIITGGIDLSLGTGMALCAVISGVLIVNSGLPMPLGVLGAVLFGGVIGLVNGINVAVLKLPPFIATLAMMLVAQGLALVISGSAPIYFNDSPNYSKISTGSIIPGTNFPNAVLIFAVLAVAAGVLLNKTVLGRYTYSIGSNEEATALSGINVRGWKLIIYTLAGLFTGLAGVLISARLGSAQPATGVGYELQAIAAVVIGGTSLSGGKGSIVGTVIGALIISVLNNGLQIMSIPQEWQNVILGCVILVAVYADMARKRASVS
ncbi:MAG: ribose transport system permease protein [Pseudonocardiales bacterium]|jgi:ribose transport system permease protein|nr:ribose transport system permease protein [Pseudonocardiales bacterium]MDT7590806.1 ribose transport system permease protein [Pseudonocardiales bacterium]MDT7629771.1 ribose transport system permease protein [Pseudonocardiales bacterium]MDT7684742.1 ribose transport system permease protein [Pseudonocardiales bacterium]